MIAYYLSGEKTDPENGDAGDRRSGGEGRGVMRPWDGDWHDQWIAVEKDVLGGQAHVRGTARTVAEIKEFWKQPGVYAAEIRTRFPDLSEAQLGAAVTWAPAPTIRHAFVADWEGPPRRQLFIWSEKSEGDGRSGGWMFAYADMDGENEWRLGWDSWEESFARILLYPPEHAPRDVVWRDDVTGQVVDIYSLALS